MPQDRVSLRREGRGSGPGGTATFPEGTLNRRWCCVLPAKVIPDEAQAATLPSTEPTGADGIGGMIQSHSRPSQAPGEGLAPVDSQLVLPDSKPTRGLVSREGPSRS